MLKGSLGSIAAVIQSVVYGGATGGLFSLLQSAGATMVLPSVGTMFAGSATTGAGIATMMSGKSVTVGEVLSDSISRGRRPGGDNDGDSSPYHHTTPQEYLLTPEAIRAIVKSWGVVAYGTPGVGAAGWLGRAHELCEAYGIPVAQRSLCVLHYLRANCQGEARAAVRYDVTGANSHHDSSNMTVCTISTILFLVLTHSRYGWDKCR